MHLHKDSPLAKLVCSGQDSHDATSSATPVPDYAASLPSVDALDSRPLQGKKIGAISELLYAGVAPGVASAIQNSIAHLQSLGADVSEVSCTDPICCKSLAQLDAAGCAYAGYCCPQ